MCSLYFFLICVHCIIRLSGYQDLSLSKSSATSQCFWGFFFPPSFAWCHPMQWPLTFLQWPSYPTQVSWVLSRGLCKAYESFPKICHGYIFVMATKPHEMTIFCKNFRCFEFILFLHYFSSSHQLTCQVKVKSKFYSLQFNLGMTFSSE